MDIPRAKVIHLDTVEADKLYERQLDHHFGINKFSCGSERITMSFVYIRPKHRARAHFHLNADLAQYIIKGRGKYHFYPGVKGQEESHDIYPGTFIFVPRGCVHIIENTGEEPIESIAAYNEVGSGDDTLKVYTESPID